MRINLLVLIGLALALLPLRWLAYLPSNSPFGREPWNFWSLLFGGVLLLLYVYKLVQLHCSKNRLTYAVIAGWVVALAAALVSNPGSITSGQTFVAYLLVLASVPVALQARSSHGRAQLLYALVMVAALQSIWATTQFTLQQNLGFQIIGESYLRPEVAGVAKFYNWDGTEKIIRAYGPYAHPNILAGSLVIGLAANLVLVRARGWRVADRVIIPTLLTGLLLTFSRSGWLAAGLALAWLGWQTGQHLRSRATFQQVAAVGVLIGLVCSPLILARMQDPEDMAQAGRVDGVLAAKQLWHSERLSGVGLGMYEESLRNLWNETGVVFQPFETDPVHSVPLLMLTELGIAYYLLFMAGAILLFMRLDGSTRWLWVAMLPLVLLDYYAIRQPATAVMGLVFAIAVSRPGRVRD